MIAAAGPSPLWYTTRGSGAVALLLLTLSLVLGIVNTSQWAPRGWPRFATSGLHRNVSLLVVAFVGLHILTAELDTYAPVGILAVLIPFASSYRPIWLGLGTVAFDLLLALTITSLLRARIGYRPWRVVHWAAYVSWPVALVHGLGTGTDARLSWMKLISVVCLAAVGAAAAWRLGHGWPAQAGARVGSATAAVVGLIAIAAWSLSGPLKPGWARRAGTPAALLKTTGGATASSGATGTGSTGTGSPGTASPGTNAAGAGIPAAPFQATVTGALTQASDANGQVTVTIRTTVSGGAAGDLVVVLRGASSGGGVSLRSGTVTFGPASSPDQYQGQVVGLNGPQISARVSSGGTALDLGLDLQIDQASGNVQGTLTAQAAGDGH